MHVPERTLLLLPILLLAIGNIHPCTACPITDGACICEPMTRAVTCSRMTSLHYRLPDGIPSDTLALSINKTTLKKIGPTAFRTTRYLRDVDLSSNRIETVSEIAFHSLERMRTLSLANNRIKLISENVFTRSSTLLRLNLSGNRLLVLVPHNFQGLSNLLELSLLNNPTMCIALDAFAGLPKLQKLEMSGMNATLDSSLFASLPNLRSLIIREFSHVKSVPVDLFSNNILLEKLYLEELPLHGKLDPDLLVPLRRLSVLSLSKCGLSELPADVIYNVKDSLTALDLSYNPLRRISQNDFKNLKKLTTLRLGRTRLTTIPANALALPNLVSLDLSGNMLSTMESSALGTDHSKLRNVSLGNNPWICDCQLKWLADEKFFHSPDIPVVCAHPDKMQGLDIRYASPNNEYFQCEKPSIRDFGIHPDGITTVYVKDNAPLAFDAICEVKGFPRPQVMWIMPSFTESNTRSKRNVENAREDVIWQSLANAWAGSIGSVTKDRRRRSTAPVASKCTVCDAATRDDKDDVWVTSDATLHVRDLSSDLAVGVYTCQATNGYGTARKSFVITKDEPPVKTIATHPVPSGVTARQAGNEMPNTDSEVDGYDNSDWPGNYESGKNSYYYYYNWRAKEGEYDSPSPTYNKNSLGHFNSYRQPARFQAIEDENPALPLWAGTPVNEEIPEELKIGCRRDLVCEVTETESRIRIKGVDDSQEMAVHLTRGITSSCCGNGARAALQSHYHIVLYLATLLSIHVCYLYDIPS